MSDLKVLATNMMVGLLLLVGIGSAAVRQNANIRHSPTRSNYDPDHQAARVQANRGGAHIETATKTKCLDCFDSFFETQWTLQVTQQGTTKTVIVNEGPIQIDAIDLGANNHGIILGRSHPTAASVVIFDLNSGAVIDKFLSLNPEISPSGRFIAYEKVFPLHFVEGVSAEYLIYDTAAGPSQNRNAKVAVNDTTDVGTAIYPVGSANVSGDNILDPRSPTHQMVSTDFFWSNDSSRVAFADRYGPTATSVIVADLSKGVNAARINAIPLDTNSIINYQACSPKGVQPGGPTALSVTNMEFVNSASIHLEFNFGFGPACLKVDSLTVPLP